jgi:hypothetical protein
MANEPMHLTLPAVTLPAEHAVRGRFQGTLVIEILEIGVAFSFKLAHPQVSKHVGAEIIS